MISATTVARRRHPIARSTANNTPERDPASDLLKLPAVTLDPRPKLGFTGIDAMPEHYALELAGNCMEPHMMSGTKAAFSKLEPVKAGDFVCIWFRPQVLPPGDFLGIFKRLSRDIPPFVTFPWLDHFESDISPALVVECFNPPRKFAIPCANVLAVHKCIGVVK